VEDVRALSRDCEDASTLRQPGISTLAGRAERHSVVCTRGTARGDEVRDTAAEHPECRHCSVAIAGHWNLCALQHQVHVPLVDVVHHYGLTGSPTM
jgi:hypothetical protein